MTTMIGNQTSQTDFNEFEASLLAAGTIFLWTLGIVVAKVFKDEIPLVGLSFWRWVAAIFILLPFVWKEILSRRDVIRQNFLLLVSQGIFLVCSSTLLFYSVNYTSAINATLVNAAQPVITGVIAWIILRETLRPIQVIGISLAAAGVILMIVRADWQILTSMEFNKGDLLLVLAMIGYGTFSVNIRKLPRELGSFATMAVVLTFGCVGLLPFYLFETYQVGGFPVTFKNVAAVILIALIVSILSMLMWSKANRVIGPGKASVFVCLMPVYGAIIGTTYLGEQLYSYHIAGGVLVCFGILLVLNKKKQPK